MCLRVFRAAYDIQIDYILLKMMLRVKYFKLNIYQKSFVVTSTLVNSLRVDMSRFCTLFVGI